MMTSYETSSTAPSSSLQTYAPQTQIKSKALDSKKLVQLDSSASKSKSDLSYSLKLKKPTDVSSPFRQTSLEPTSFFLDSFPDWNVHTLKHLITQLDKKVNDINEDLTVVDLKSKQVSGNMIPNTSALPTNLQLRGNQVSSIPLPSTSARSMLPAATFSLSSYDLKLPYFFIDPSRSQPQNSHSTSFRRSTSTHVGSSSRQSHSTTTNKNSKPSTHFVSEWVMSMSKSTGLKLRKPTQANILKPVLSSSSSVSSLSSTYSYYTSYSSKFNPTQLMEPVKLGKLGISKDAEFEKRTEKMRKAKEYGDYIRQSHASSLQKKKLQSKSENSIFTSAAFEQRKRIQEYVQKIPKPKPVKLPPIDTQGRSPLQTGRRTISERPPEMSEHNALEVATQLYYRDLDLFENLKREFNV